MVQLIQVTLQERNNVRQFNRPALINASRIESLSAEGTGTRIQYISQTSVTMDSILIAEDSGVISAAISNYVTGVNITVPIISIDGEPQSLTASISVPDIAYVFVYKNNPAYSEIISITEKVSSRATIATVSLAQILSLMAAGGGAGSDGAFAVSGSRNSNGSLDRDMNKADSVATSVSPYIMPAAGILTYITANTDTSETWEAHVLKNGVSVSFISISAATQGVSSELSIPFTAGDQIRLRQQNGVGSISRPSINAHFKLT